MTMRSRVPLFALLFVAGSLVLPLVAHAGGIPFLGPIIPQGTFIPEGTIGPTTMSQATCPLGWGALINVINNIISFLITIAIVFIAPLMIAYSGFLFVVNPVNPSGREDAKNILSHTIVGIVIALSGWLIVSAVMAVLYDSKAFGKNWSDLITSDGVSCLEQAGALGETSSQVSRAPTLTVAPQPSIPTSDILQKPPSEPTTALPFKPTMTEGAIKSAALGAKAFKDFACATAMKEGIPGECNQILGIIAIESEGNQNIISPKGAIGVMQLIPTTAAGAGVSACKGSTNINPSPECVSALRDPKTNIQAGVMEYAKLYKKFNNNTTNATAAYNAGSGSGLTQDGKKNAFAPSTDCPGLVAWQCPINPGGLIETQRYVPNVAAAAKFLSS